MILKKILLSIVIIIFSLNVYSTENKILIKVDNKIITSVDVYKETQYLIAINNRIQKLSKNKIFEIAKNSLIKKKIKQNEISKYLKKIDLDEKYIDQLIETNALKLGFNSLNDFENHLINFDINIENLRKRLAIEILWNELIFSKYSKKLVIDKEKIKKEIQLNDKKIKSFLLSEIVFNVSVGITVKDKFQKITSEIKKTGFENAALIYSVSDTSSSGGKLGWIKETSLNNTIKEKVLNLKTGGYSEPIKIPGGFLVLKVENIKEINVEIDIKKELTRRIRNKENQQLSQFSLLYYNKIKKDAKIDEL